MAEYSEHPKRWQHSSIPVGCQRRGTTYVLVLMVASILFTVSLAGLTSLRILRRSLEQSDDARAAMWLAQSGLEHAVTVLSNYGDWRERLAHNQNSEWFQLGDGRFRWRLVDDDGDLTDNPNDPVTVVAIGQKGDAIRTLSQQLEPTGTGLEVLQSAVHCSGNLSIQSNKIWQGRFSSNGQLSIPEDHQVSGDGQEVIAAGVSLDIAGTLTNGGAVQLRTGLEMPRPETLEYYKSRATTLDFQSTVEGSGWRGKILSAFSNPWGIPNPEGLYYIQVPEDEAVEIEDCRIKATLLVEIEEEGQLEVKSNVVWEPPAVRYPSLIAKALGPDVEFNFAGSGTLSEAQWATNMNPPGLPYRGLENGSTTDQLPATLRGLFHISRPAGDSQQTVIAGDLPHKGCFLIEGNVLVTGTCFASDPALWQDAPVGYVSQPVMRPKQGSTVWIATEAGSPE